MKINNDEIMLFKVGSEESFVTVHTVDRDIS